IAQIGPGEHFSPLAIDDFSLLVHHVVVFKHALTDIKVIAFDTYLRLLDRLADHAMLDGLIFGDFGPRHHVLDTVAAEAFHQVVFEAKIETALARIALTARATAQLVVDTPGFMALRAEYEQAARL